MPAVAPTADPLHGLIDSTELARRLGVSKATIRSWRSRGATWLPEPVGRLDGFVWQERDVESIRALIPHGPGRPAAPAPRFTASERRGRGAYYTPRDAAHFLAAWALQNGARTMLEPSFGDGSFIRAVSDEARARDIMPPRWIAMELDAASAEAVVAEGLLTQRDLRIGDFLLSRPEPVDAVVANPPFVRLRHLDAQLRENAYSAGRVHFTDSMSPSGSLWMPFVAHMMSFLVDGGRLATVLPLDFTYVTYARPLWRHLAKKFGSLRVIRVRQRVFSDLNQDVLLLLADQFGGSTTSATFEAYETVEDLTSQKNPRVRKIEIDEILSGERVFQRALLSESLLDLLETVGPQLRRASDLATFRIGYISGDKHYFHPSPKVVKEFNLPRSSLRPALVSARRIRGLGLTTAGMDMTSADVLWSPSAELTEEEERYVALGERTRVSEGYKASMRSPWYRVPGVAAPDVVLSVFSERPLLVVNDAGWLASNSLLGGYLREGTAPEFAAAWYTPLTLLSIGLEVHALGGGVVVMVPNEASRVQLAPAGAPTAELEDALIKGDIATAYQTGSAAVCDVVGTDGLRLINEGVDQLTRWRAK